MQGMTSQNVTLVHVMPAMRTKLGCKIRKNIFTQLPCHAIKKIVLPCTFHSHICMQNYFVTIGKHKRDTHLAVPIVLVIDSIEMARSVAHMEVTKIVSNAGNDTIFCLHFCEMGMHSNMQNGVHPGQCTSLGLVEWQARHVVLQRAAQSDQVQTSLSFKKLRWLTRKFAQGGFRMFHILFSSSIDGEGIQNVAHN